MKKRGFTLIELLAVIVILAIIALIATPIVMNLIENARKGAAERSAENYLDAVETAVATKRLDNEMLEGRYSINSEGELCFSQIECVKIEMSGNKPTGGIVDIENGIVKLLTIVIGNYTVDYDNTTKVMNAYIWEDKYQPVSYLETTGEQYIDTNIYLRSEYDVEFKFSTSSFATSQSSGFSVFSSNDTTIDPNWHFSSNLTSNVGQSVLFGWKYFAGTYSSGTAFDELKLNTDYIIRTSGNDWYFNNVKFDGSGLNTMAENKISPTTMKLFAGISKGEIKIFNVGNLKIYYFKVLDGEKEVANLIPAYRKSDNVKGMYDSVSGYFYANAYEGETDFNIGEEV